MIKRIFITVQIQFHTVCRATSVTIYKKWKRLIVLFLYDHLPPGRVLQNEPFKS